MKFPVRAFLLLAVFLVYGSGCSLCGHGQADVEELGPPLLRLTSAVQGVAERPEVYGFTPNAGGEACINLAVEDDPGLLVPFEDYVLKAKCENQQGVVLVCNSAGDRALLEDAGCTTRLDFRGDGASRACDFNLDVNSLCN